MPNPAQIGPVLLLAVDTIVDGATVTVTEVDGSPSTIYTDGAGSATLTGPQIPNGTPAGVAMTGVDTAGNATIYLEGIGDKLVSCAIPGRSPRVYRIPARQLASAESALIAAVAAVGTTVTAHGTRLDTLDTENTAQGVSITGLTSSVASLGTTVGSHTTELASHDTHLTTLDGEVTSAAAAAAANANLAGLLAGLPASGSGSHRFYYATDDLAGTGQLYQDNTASGAFTAVRTPGSGQSNAPQETITGSYLYPVSGYTHPQASKAGAAFGNAVRCVDSPFRLPAPALDLTGPWTIELYVAPERLNVTEAVFAIFDTPTATATAGVEIGYSGGSALNLYYYTAAGLQTLTISNPGAQLSRPSGFVAVTYDGTTIRTFLNGALTASVATAVKAVPTPAWSLAGFPDRAFGGTFKYRGQIDELRVSNSCRYTAAYAAPTAPLTPDTHTLLLLNGSTWKAAVATADPNVLVQNPGGDTNLTGTVGFPDGIRLGPTAQYGVSVPGGGFWLDARLNAPTDAYPVLANGQTGQTGMGLKLTPNSDGFAPFQVWSVGGPAVGSAYPLFQVVSNSVEFGGGYNRPDVVLERQSYGAQISTIAGQPDTRTGGTSWAAGKAWALAVYNEQSPGLSSDPTYLWSIVNLWQENHPSPGVFQSQVLTSGFRRNGLLDMSNVGYGDAFGNKTGAGYDSGSAPLAAQPVITGTAPLRIGDKISLYAPTYGNRVGIGSGPSAVVLYSPATAAGGTYFTADAATSSVPTAASLFGPGDVIHPLSGAVEIGPGAVSTAPSRMLSVADSADWPSVYVKKFAGATQPAFQAVSSAGTQLAAITATGGLQSGTGLSSGAAGAHLSLSNVTTEPTAATMSGGVLYALGGALYWRGGGGHVTKIAEA